MPALYKFDLTNFRLTKLNISKASLINYSSFNSEAYVYDPNFTGPTLTASGANSRIKMKHENKIRRMNPNEAFRYMGFSDIDFKKIEALNFISETQMIYVCGNSISVEVLESIMLEIYNNAK